MIGPKFSNRTLSFRQIGLKVLREEEWELERLTNTTSGLVQEQNKLKNEDKMLKSDLELVKRELTGTGHELSDLKIEVQNIKQEIQLKVNGYFLVQIHVND